MGLDARELLHNDEPVFVWRVGKFKNLRDQAKGKEAAIVSFCTSVARAAASAMLEPPRAVPSAPELREALLEGNTVVELGDLVVLCWSIGVPIMCLKVVPLSAKNMHAMAVKVRGRHAILLARDINYPAQAAFDIAHELGHIALGHVSDDSVLADFEDPLQLKDNDPEEAAATAYALELLTGEAAPTVLPNVDKFLARGLAEAAIASAPALHIDAGTLVLCMGHATGQWAKVMTALKHIYGQPLPVCEQLNKAALAQLADGELSAENEEYLRGALGLPE